MGDFNIGGRENTGSFLFCIAYVSVVLGLVFIIDLIYGFMKSSPLKSIGLLLVILYGLCKIKIPERVNDKYWPLVPALKWSVEIISIVLIGCLLIKVLG